jgi:hypothetical protein
MAYCIHAFSKYRPPFGYCVRGRKIQNPKHGHCTRLEPTARSREAGFESQPVIKSLAPFFLPDTIFR